MKKRLTSKRRIAKRLISTIIALAMVFTLVQVIPVTPTTKVEAASGISIGQYVQMGKYYDEPILWRCVDIDANGPLMLADRILTIKPFDAAGNHKYLDGTAQTDTSGYRTNSGSNLWETSNMRSWLNSSATAGNVTWLDGCPPTADKVWDGYNAYASEKGFLALGNFTSSEQNAVKIVTQKSLLNGVDVAKLSVGGTATHIYSGSISTVVQNFDTAYYQNVTDKMFLLDVKQLNKVYQNSATLGANYYIGKPTQKAVDNSEYKDSSYLKASDYWYNWNRSPYAGSGPSSGVRSVLTDGSVYIYTANFNFIGARPAFYLNLSSASFRSGDGSVGAPYIVAGTTETTPTPKPTPTLGDVNNDSKITAVDALMVLQGASGKVVLTSNQTLAADVNKDGKVSAVDALKILQYASGKINGF